MGLGLLLAFAMVWAACAACHVMRKTQGAGVLGLVYFFVGVGCAGLAAKRRNALLCVACASATLRQATKTRSCSKSALFLATSTLACVLTYVLTCVSRLWLCLCLCFSQVRQHGGGCAHLVARGDLRLGCDGQVHINARAKADEAVALATVQRVARFDVAQDAPRNEPCYLHKCDCDGGAAGCSWGGDDYGVALVFE